MRASRLLIPLVVPALLLAGCGDDDPDATSDPTPTPVTSTPPSPTSEGPSGATAPSEPEAKGVVLDITIKGDTITPNGERIEAEVGEPIIVMIDADRAGELHVHSTPEQEIEFAAGKSQEQLVIEQPGVVEVEDHEAEFVIAQLQVS